MFARSFFAAVLLAFAFQLNAATLSGTIKDPSGALVPNAQIEISGGAQAVRLSSDGHGAFTSPDLPPGTYSVRITHDGFQELEQTVSLGKEPLSLEFKLVLAAAHEEVKVTGGQSSFANNDPVYRMLRSAGVGRFMTIKDQTLVVDAGTFRFTQGTLAMVQPVSGHVTGVVFSGEGHFTLKPVTVIDRNELRRRTGSDVYDEDFKSVVFRFSPGQQRYLLALHPVQTDNDGGTPAAYSQWQDRVRSRRETPISFSEAILDDAGMDNVDADMLAAIYNPTRPPVFNAYIHGSKHKDLRFFMRMHGGALPQLDSPEEIALVNFAPDSLDDGIWYLAHTKAEYEQNKATSQEERRFFKASNFKLDTYIGNNNHLTGVATIELTPVIAGERVVKFNLLPNLRVTRVTDGLGKELYYVQESRKADGSFYVILPTPSEAEKQCTVSVEYSGDKVIWKAGEGSFYIRARESWYPTPNGFSERSLYDLTYHVPKHYRVISVGSLDKESIEDKYAVSHWVTPKPVAIAGFNFGNYQKQALFDPKTEINLEGYYLPDLPDFLKHLNAAQSLAPGSMTKYALSITQAQLQLCNYYFGSNGFDRIYITEQPDFNFGQSWPNLVYLPISAYTDATQRYLLFAQISNSFSAFVQEVTPHEVAHQWWGHAVGWASYHDQWLSEGFAEFSAALFLENTGGSDWQKRYTEFWERLRKEVLNKNQWGESPNDAGPIWLGLRLMSPKDPSAYQANIYPKGAYILEMLRSLMHSNKDGDKAFIDMMHDFVSSHRDTPASTESFKAIAEKHITHSMDVNHNGRLNWFFDEWAYGTQVPKYAFTYDLKLGEHGHAKVHFTLTQSEVDNNFVMAVPIFAEMNSKGNMVRIGQVWMTGNTTQSMDIDLPATPKSMQANALKEILTR
jgi:hypothetical protein